MIHERSITNRERFARPSIFAALAAILVLAGCGASPHTSVRHPPRQPASATSTERALSVPSGLGKKGGVSFPSQSATGSVAPPGWGRPAPALLGLAPTAAATAAMFDSVDVATIPRAPFAAAGYTGGHWRTFPQIRGAYPHTHTISIAVFPWERAACADVEPGDLTPSQAPGWVRADERAGYRKPCLYSDYWEWTQQLAPALKRAGIALASIFRWVASYVGHPQLLAGFDADQWTDHYLGRNLDCSLVLRSFLAVARPPLEPPIPVPHRKSSHAKQIAYFRMLARKHGCYRRHHRKPHACLVWAQQVRALR